MEGLDPLSPEGRQVFNEIKARHEKTHVFLAPEVIEVHLQKNLPIPEGTARLMWALKILFEGVDDV